MGALRRLWLTFRQLKTWLQFVIVVVFISLLGVIGGSGSNTSTSNAPSSVSTESPSAKASPEEPKVAPKPWFPKGFSEFQDGIAFKWTTGSCDFGRCAHALVIAKYGCPNGLYVEVNGFDKSSTQVDYTNDVTSYLAPMKQAKLTFNFTDDSASTVQISKVNCY